MNNKQLLLILTVLLVILFLIGLGLSIARSKQANTPPVSESATIPAQEAAPESEPQQVPAQEPSVQEAEPTSAPGELSEAVSEEAADTLSELRTLVEEALRDRPGVWAVYVENLNSGECFELGNCKMVSASLIKLFIMGEVYRELQSGELTDKPALDSYLEQMITVSDNEASNVLVARLGGGAYSDMYAQTFQDGLKKVNAFAASNGCYDTEQQRDMKDSRPQPIPEQNYTSAKDCGTILSKLYHKELVSEAYDTEMLELLLRQTRRGKIPAGLPDTCRCANKTGELSTVENDTAIVFSPACDYILCVLSNDVPNTTDARDTITELSSIVYRYFNP